MIVEKLYIKNYRCFGEIPTVIEFSESGLTALIGPNNVGKSTVLRILDILLGDKWPSGRFSEDDFHNNNLKNEIVLACTFFKPIEIEVKKQKIPIKVKGVALRAKHLLTGYGESSIDIDYRLLKSARGIEELNFDKLDIAGYRRSEVSKGDAQIYIGQEIRNQLPIVITVPLVKLISEQPTNRWSVLGRMLQKVENMFTTDESKKIKFENEIKEAVNILRIDDFNEIEKDIKEFWEEMKPKNLTGTELKFFDYEPWRYYRQFKLSIQQNDKDVPIETLGEGVQRLAVIALYRAYLKRHGRSQNAILLIEEPESYLHPQARKNLFNILKKVVDKRKKVEGQIIYTTHSEDFIECGSFDNIVIFLRNADTNNIEVRHITKNSLKDHTKALGQSEISDQHIHYRLMEIISQGLKEALFTHKTIIVEGPSELELFRLFTDAEEEQIGIVSAGGKRNIPAIYSFLTAFGIPCLIVIDSDDKPGTDSDNERIVKVLNQENANSPDKTKLEITKEEIMNVKDGEIFIKAHLLVFGKNLETVLDKKIKNWCQILQLLRKKYNLPTDKGKPSPRDIHALGLAFSDKSSINSEELKKAITEATEGIEELKKKLNEFIFQKLKTPQLLEPKNGSYARQKD